MTEREYFRSEKLRRNLFYISISLYVAAAILPSSWDMNGACPFLGLIFSVLGWLAFFMGEMSFLMIGIFWLASPFLFIAWYNYNRKPRVSVICAILSLVCWGFILPFLIETWSLEYGILIIYSLGLSAIAIILLASINQYQIQRNFETLTYEN